MPLLGQINLIPTEEGIDVEWAVKNFFSFPEIYYVSSVFSFKGKDWHLGMFPNGDYKNHSKGCVDLRLYQHETNLPISVDVLFALRTFDGKKILQSAPTAVQGGGLSQNCYRFISKSDLQQRKSELVPFNVFTIVCSLKIPKPTTRTSNIETKECTYCKETVSVEVTTSHEKKCLSKPVKCPECSEIVLLQNWYEHECQISSEEASLSHDFKTILLSGNHSDTIVKVKEEEFRLHRSILAARNPYFDAMFQNDMKEKSTGIVTIDDCDPGVFRSFMHFIYSGKVDKLSSGNACQLYKAADKYQDDHLKKECLHFMLNTISVDTFCDYFVLSFTHDEKELLQKCFELFTTKAKDIVRSVKWQTLLKEYTTQANELLIKTFDKIIK